MKVSVGGTALNALPFEDFEDYPGFVANWAERLVPPPAQINHWDHTTQTWEQPVLTRPILVRPAIQCLQADTFGVRDTKAEQAMLSRLCDGLRINADGLRGAVEDALPPAQFEIDPNLALSAEQKTQRSWKIHGKAHFAHFVLRSPVGRISDWVLVTVAMDFSLSATPATVPIHAPASAMRPAREQDSGGLAERVSNFLASQPGAAARPAGLSARGRS